MLRKWRKKLRRLIRVLFGPARRRAVIQVDIHIVNVPDLVVKASGKGGENVIVHRIQTAKRREAR